ncbi:ATP-binding cassette protein [Histoplasma capsulatum G186AR]|uniref:ATP-binding cassette protein n=1 Tax=Ajellomyces capsulatus (strain G186AR / H82 / ATCC MYA-2454 / RMSCC 2432) TaxID=447093 RepID=C0NXM2_AJECG|nr:ATP-binding cassette protein [Histoplasma capsulatum G186AR]EEH04088.1 ATP-binding cassette protein [Histoplasma capsulatum G186AR]
MRPPSLASSLLYASILASSSLPWLASAFSNYSDSSLLLSSRVLLQDDRPKDCPPCFNCELEAFQCHQFAACNKYNGKCDCPAGFGGDDCTLPLCGSLPDGKERAPRKGKYCNCTEGWEGVNCNVCKTDNVCNSMMPEGEGGVCYKDGVTQKENYQMCAVTNRKIVDMLGDQKPEVTFSCKESDHKCNFQFWVDQVESFYCNLDTCKWGMESTYSQNKTTYTCENKDALDLSDFLKEEIKGPATFTSTSTLGGSSEDGSRFSEPVMNDMIKNIFGDPAIFLACRSGECLYKTDLPGYKPPVKVINTPLISGVIASCSLFIVAVIMGVWYLSRRSAYRDYISLPLDDSDDEGAKLMVDHKPASLHFENVAYYLNGRQILSGIQGSAHPGQLMAIMGASGAGKTTFLDILARKNKRGTVEGVFYVNGEKVDDDEYRSVIGFVDQEDTMLPTLTVHETIFTSALLRLPRNMSRAAKEQKVFEVEKQLGIYHIKDQIIGSEEGRGRGISGGEKRRVGIACELVTSPSILFLDEPTSGLDAFNAFNVVECLVTLAKNFNRTVIFTIHQPRSNIVALFDQLILLAEGKTVYSGPFASCQPYFDHIGYSCPSGFNIADYLVDLTMHASNTHSRYEDEIHLDVNHDAARTATSSLRAVKSIASVSNASVDNSSSDRPNESGFRPISKRKESLKQRQDKQLYTRRRAAEVGTPSTLRTEDEEHIVGSLSGNGQHRSRQPNNVTLRVIDDPDQPPPSSAGFGTDLDHLVSSYIESNVAASVRDEINAAVNMAAEANGFTSSGLEANGSLNKSMTGYAKVGLYRQFTILSQRTWRNLYRNPMLMLTHYAIAIVLAVLSGFLFYGLTDDIKGFQNRLGLFFFLLALFGFSTLTSLNVFSTERLLFVRERANGYYSPITYFASKVAFDIVPLRLIPPILMGIIVYPMVGLIPAWPEFLRFMLILLLFNLAAACICLTIGIVFKDSSVANLMGSLVMLFSLLFAGLLLNRDAIPKSALWLQVLSIFHYGFEGLIVNEVTYLTLIDHKYGLDIEVPGASILSAFGFNTLGLWHDVIGLGIFSGVFIVIAYAAMHFLLVEKR